MLCALARSACGGRYWVANMMDDSTVFALLAMVCLFVVEAVLSLEVDGGFTENPLILIACGLGSVAYAFYLASKGR